MSGINCVTDTVLLGIKRYGTCDFLNDGAFDGGSETYHSDITGALISGLQLSHHKIVANAIVELSAGEKTTIDTDEANQAVGVASFKSRRTLETIGADVNIEWRPCVSQITAYVSPISLGDGTAEGQEKKIYNDGTGVFILINCTLPGSDTQVRINNNQNCTLMWNGSLWRHIDGIVGITLQ